MSGSSQYAWSPGMQATFIDHLLVRPKTSWRGVRGVRSHFGAQEDIEEKADALAIDEAEDDFWDMPSAALRFVDVDDVADFDLDMEEEIEEDEDPDFKALFGSIPGTIGIEAWEQVHGSGLTRADILESTAIDDLLETDAAMEAEEFGRLYLGQEGYHMQEASDSDLGALSGQSGRSGYRGGRPTFGTSGSSNFGPIEYTGNQWAAFALSAASLAVFAKAMKVF